MKTPPRLPAGKKEVCTEEEIGLSVVIHGAPVDLFAATYSLLSDSQKSATDWARIKDIVRLHGISRASLTYNTGIGKLSEIFHPIYGRLLRASEVRWLQANPPKRGRGHSIAPDVIASIRARIEAGESVANIAAERGVSRTAIYSLICRARKTTG